MSDIFISYSHKDEDFVRKIVPALEAEGYTVWWDNTIPPGQTWDDVIARGINEAKACIVVWSRDSVVSDWVKEEATLAKNRGKYLPVQIGGELPMGFTRIQAADLRNWFGNAQDAQWRLLIDEITKRAGVGNRKPIPDADPVPDPAPIPTKKWLIGLAPLVIAGLAWWMFSGRAASVSGIGARESVVGKWNGTWHMDSDPPGQRFGFIATFMPDHTVMIQNPLGTFTGQWRQSGSSLRFDGGGGTDSATVTGDRMSGTVEVSQRKGTFEADR
jgi:hypothetical protein